MRVLFHPEFPQDVRRFVNGYAGVSSGLAERFRIEIEDAIGAIKAAPNSAGHFLNLGSQIVPELRRRNLRAFPFFLLYGATSELLIFGSVIPSHSDPLTWLARFQKPPL
jgi:hypothetical protein